MDGSAIEKLITDISKLPGIGRRSAQRIALYLLKNKDRSLLPLIQTLESSHKLISECSNCGNVDMTKSHVIFVQTLTEIKINLYY